MKSILGIIMGFWQENFPFLGSTNSTGSASAPKADFRLIFWSFSVGLMRMALIFFPAAGTNTITFSLSTRNGKEVSVMNGSERILTGRAKLAFWKRARYGGSKWM